MSRVLVAASLTLALFAAGFAFVSERASAALLTTPGTISAGGSHTCAIKTDNTPICWGKNDQGQATVPVGVGTVKQISAGKFHTCAIKTDDTPVCWGMNDAPQLLSTIPGDVTTVTKIVATLGQNTCIIEPGNDPRCWGDNFGGKIHLPSGVDMLDLGGGSYHGCGLKTDGKAVCWLDTADTSHQTFGHNTYGQQDIPDLNETFSQIAVGHTHNCAIKTTNSNLVCWGDDDFGQLPMPVSITAVDQVSAGTFHTCVVRSDDSPACFGGDFTGQSTVPSSLTAVSQISAGGGHSCATTAAGVATCWGDAQWAQGGPPVFNSTSLPSAINGAALSYEFDGTPSASISLPTTFTLDSGSLPNGLTLDPDGTLHGTPTTEGGFSFVVRASNGVFADGTSSVQIDVDFDIPTTPGALATNPASPSTSTTPNVTGTTDSDTTVEIFANDSCSGSPISSGTAAEFTSTGISTTVAAVATTELTAKATDLANNVSACSSPISYTNVAPVVPPTDPGGGSPNNPPSDAPPTMAAQLALSKFKSKLKKGKLNVTATVAVTASGLTAAKCSGKVRVAVTLKVKKKTKKLATKSFALKFAAGKCTASVALKLAKSSRKKRPTFSLSLVDSTQLTAPLLSVAKRI